MRLGVLFLNYKRIKLALSFIVSNYIAYQRLISKALEHSVPRKIQFNEELRDLQ